MRGRARRFEGLRLCAAVLLACWIAAPSSALDWQWGEVTGRLDSFASVGFSLRTQAPKCFRIPNLTGALGAPFGFPAPANNPGGCIDPDDTETNAMLLNADDGNLNWDQWDVFSVAFKGSHDLELRWRNLGGFLRVSYFIDAIGADAAKPERTHLAEDSRWRTSVLEGGVVGGQFLLLDAYFFAGFDVGERYFDFRVGNQVVNWGESTFTQGGINATNTIDVTKIRLPGSDIREALFPAPIVKVGGDIIGALSLEAYYQFAWRQFEIDPPGTFFSAEDMVGRGAEGFFNPFWGDPGSTGMTAEEIFAESFPISFFIAAPFMGDKEPSDQGQLGVALRYYSDAIETEFGVYYIRLHAKTPVVGFEGTQLGIGSGQMKYFREFPEGIDLFGLSFNTVLFGTSVAGEVSVRRNEPVPTISAQPDLAFDLIVNGEGGVYSGFKREMRLIGIVNGVYVVGPGTPLTRIARPTPRPWGSTRSTSSRSATRSVPRRATTASSARPSRCGPSSPSATTLTVWVPATACNGPRA
ncbi:MAG: DUF1302 family protein [Deltaproteobacteria bacterium]|nr:DUF1302 family protein [Deltaproteobacteria bacterium]